MRNNKTSHFGLVFKKLVIEHRRTIITTICTYIGVCLVIGLWCGFYKESPDIVTTSLYGIAASFVCFAVASKLGFDLLRKESRIAMLMTPASALEKYMSRFLLFVPGIFILRYLGLLVFSYSMILSNGIFNGQWASYYSFFSFIGESFETKYFTVAIAYTCCYFLFIEAIYLFGATLWPKLAFLKSSGVIVGLGMVFFTIMASITYHTLGRFGRGHEINVGLYGWLITSLLFAAACILVYFSYRVFKNTMVNKSV